MPSSIEGIGRSSPVDVPQEAELAAHGLEGAPLDVVGRTEVQRHGDLGFDDDGGIGAHVCHGISSCWREGAGYGGHKQRETGEGRRDSAGGGGAPGGEGERRGWLAQRRRGHTTGLEEDPDS